MPTFYRRGRLRIMSLPSLLSLFLSLILSSAGWTKLWKDLSPNSPLSGFHSIWKDLSTDPLQDTLESPAASLNSKYDYRALKDLESPEQLYANLGLKPPGNVGIDHRDLLLNQKESVLPADIPSLDDLPDARIRMDNEEEQLGNMAQLSQDSRILTRKEQELEQRILRMKGQKKDTNLLQAGAPDDDVDKEIAFQKLPFPDQLYLKLLHIFGTEDTLLTLEFPGRVLDQKTFHYPIVDSYSDFLKPVPVRDAEFSLADEMYYPVQITGGPTGNSLSTMYKFVLDELAESIDYPAEAYKTRREKILSQLSKVFESPDPSLGANVTLRRLHEYFVDKYITLKGELQRQLNHQKNTVRLLGPFPQDKADGGETVEEAGDDFASLDATEAETVSTQSPEQKSRDALMDEIPLLNDEMHTKLNAAWKDLIIEGRHHEVMSMLSILDVQSPGELLQETKDRMRNSGMSSMDGTETTYPVWFQPRTWSEGLTTKFTTRDLLMEPDNVMMEVNLLQDQKQSMVRELTTLQDLQTGDENVAQKEMAAAKTKLDASRLGVVDMFGPFGAWVGIPLAMCKRSGDCVQPDGELSPEFAKSLESAAERQDRPTDQTKEAIEAVKTKKESRSDEAKKFIADLAGGVSDYINRHQRFAQAAERYHRSVQAMSLAKATDFQGRKTTLQRQLKEVELKIQAKMALLAGARTNINASKEPLTPTGSQAGPFMDVIFVTSASSAVSRSQMSSSTQSSDSSFNFLGLGGYSKRKIESEAQASNMNGAKQAKWEIGFSAMKVTIDRGGWFKPEFMQHSEMFMKNGNLKDKKIALGKPKNSLRPQDALASAQLASEMERYRECLFPTFPLGFILVRDVTIRMSFSESMSEVESSTMKKEVSSASSVLGFGSARGSSEEAGSEGTSTMAQDQFLVIKIPGPQILAWIQRFVAQDKCKIADFK